MSRWADVGRYGAPHRMVTAVLTFGLIFQQVVFPSLARSWRETAAVGRKALDALVLIDADSTASSGCSILQGSGITKPTNATYGRPCCVRDR